MLRSKKIALVGALIITVLIVVSACGKKSSQSDSNNSSQKVTATKSVKIHTFMFMPNPLVIQAGTKVTWTNEDEIHHTVTSGKRNKPDGKFDHTLSGKGKTFSYVFSKPGTYFYYCDIHPGMDAEIDVK